MSDDAAPAQMVAINLIGFDSAWVDRPNAPGAICAFSVDADGNARFDPPELAGFAAALTMIKARHRPGVRTILAIDQPTIVPNAAGARPCERVVASVMSWSGGGIQPAYRGKASMFGDAAPIWRFLDALGFTDDPKAARLAEKGGFVMEVFPALALLGLDPTFIAAARAGPRYNPARPTFKREAWRAVIAAVAAAADDLRLRQVADWCRALDADARPRKALQDKLDSVICLLVAALWIGDRGRCAMIGDLRAGYIVAPVAPAIQARLEAAAARLGVAIV